jgi:hypothetical protein
MVVVDWRVEVEGRAVVEGNAVVIEIPFSIMYSASFQQMKVRLEEE